MDSDAVRAGHPVIPYGGALAAVLAAGIGAFTLGLLVIADAAGTLVAPTIYGPSGGLSGRSTLAVVTWLIAWGVLNARWRNRNVAVGRVLMWSLVLVALAVIMTFPPVWGLLE
jgi:hypothetical protein